MRPEHLANEESLLLFLRGFEDGTLPKAEWTHGAHVAAAAYYLHEASRDGASQHGAGQDGSGQDGASQGGADDVAYDMVLPLIRHRIQSYNLAVGGANTATSGYHETLTRFWLHVVAALLRERRPGSSLEASQLAVASLGEQRSLHTQYYSGDVVKDSAARRVWREPDMKPLP